MVEKKETIRYELVVIPAGTIDGVHIPFVSLTPLYDYDEVPVFCLYYGKNSASFIEDALDYLSDFAEQMGVAGPVIMPLLPPQAVFQRALDDRHIDLHVGDTQMLCRECFSKKIPADFPFYRLDQQLDRILEVTAISSRFVGFGHCSSGTALLRYVMISPQHFNKLIIGGNADCVPVMAGPLSKQLDYPLGTRDYDLLFNRKYRKAAYASLNCQFYLSDKIDQVVCEDNSLLYDRISVSQYQSGKGQNCCPEDVAKAYLQIYSENLLDRFSEVMDTYEKAFLNVNLGLYHESPDHMITRDDFQNIVYSRGSFEGHPVQQLRNIQVADEDAGW